MRVGCKCWPWPRAIEKGFKRIEEGEGEKEGEGEEGWLGGRKVGWQAGGNAMHCR